ncbi:MAG: transporter substrate-binding domain-containing protein [Cyanobacteria bacterium SID2]|nr:transporter substrate-binding domain-containing protein [Cyanobacteria bacterium SID2]MBP0003964.1 transporter substrate-binding domain-containing protein [Cyanobacteria bacterium SBC]
MSRRSRWFQRSRGSVRLIVALSLALASIVRSVEAAPLPEILDRGHLVVAVKDNLRPLGFRDEAGQLQGLEIDIARQLAWEILGDADAVVFEPVSNLDRLSVVIEDEVDIAIARVTQTRSRERLVHFSLPYYLDGTAIVTRHPEVRQLSDLNRLRIAVLEGSSTVPVIRYTIPTAQFVAVADYQEALATLEADRADAFAADLSVLTGWVQEYPHYTLLSETLSTEPLCVVMPKGLQYDELRRQVNAAIARWRADGWLAERAAYWGL